MDLRTAEGEARADGSCLSQRAQLPPSLNATRVGTGDGWLPGGGKATPVDFGGPSPPPPAPNQTTQIPSARGRTRRAGGQGLQKVPFGTQQTFREPEHERVRKEG